MTPVRRLVHVSGAPGAGKTSLAGPLAAELGYALLTKDTIKETLHDTLGAPEAGLAWSRRLGGPQWSCCGHWRRGRPRW
jgi:predicted kinase